MPIVSISTMQFVSDVHREYEHHLGRPWPKIVPRARYLALAGDIGNPAQKSYSAYLSYCCSLFHHVFVVAGNHEFWGHEYNTCKRKIRSICAEKRNCTFLDDEMVEVDGLRVFGATLWSDVSDRAAEGMNDYNTIYYEHKNLTADDTRGMHRKTVATIKGLLDESCKPLLVITHYAPLHAMNGRYGNSPNISAFCSELGHLFRKPLVGWISGHTHSSVQMAENGIPCLSNCWGYDVKEYAGYRQDAVLDLTDVHPYFGSVASFGKFVKDGVRVQGVMRRPRLDPLDDKQTWLSQKPAIQSEF